MQLLKKKQVRGKFLNVVTLLRTAVAGIRNNKPGPAQVGAISKAQK